MAAKDLIIQFDEFQARRVERFAKMFDLTPEDFCEFSIIKTANDIENFERIVRDPDLKSQLREIVELKKSGKLSPEEFAGEVEELLSMPGDDEWTPDA
jgi:hypothetical protein